MLRLLSISAAASPQAPRETGLAKDTRGAATVLTAMAMFMLLGVATVSIDLGSIYLAKRKLQGVADAAAMAAAQEHTVQLRRQAAALVIDESNVDDVTIEVLESGTYAQDKDIPLDDRFQKGGDETTSRLTLVQTVPLFFGRALGFENAVVSAKATAARVDMAAYSLGTKLAAVSGGIPNQLLSSLIGTQLNLSVVDSQGLATANIDVLDFAEAVKAQIGGDDLTYAEVFAKEISLNDVLQGMAGSVSNAGTAQLLRQIAEEAEFVDLSLADIIDLGPYGRLDYYPGKAGVEVDAYSLLRTVLELSHGDTYDISFGLDVTGLSNVTVRLTGGRGMAHSPWLTVTGAKDYVLRSSQARLLLQASAGTGNRLLPSIRIPLFVELAEGEAQLSDISCTGDPDTDGVTLAVSPSPGTLGIGTFDPEDMDDFSAPILLEPATLVNIPLIARVTGLSEIELGGTTTPQEVLFSNDDIRDRVIKTVSTNDITQSIASSLVSQTHLNAKALGLSLNLSTITSLVGNTLSIAAPVLDSTVYSLTQAMGIKIGAADVRVNKVHCGVPTIIA